MKYFQKTQMQMLKEIFRHPAMIKAVSLIVYMGLFSCKIIEVNKERSDTYAIVSSFIEGYTEKRNKNVYLNPYMIEKDSYILKKNIFNDFGYIHDEVCDKEINVTKEDFIISMKNEKTGVWDYDKIKSKRLTTKITLNEVDNEEYEQSNIKNMLENKHEIYTYKYTLWDNPDRIPLIRIALPFVSKNKKYAILYMSKHYDGTFVWILERMSTKKWNIICEKRLSHY